jgi:hypothetical protein
MLIVTPISFYTKKQKMGNGYVNSFPNKSSTLKTCSISFTSEIKEQNSLNLPWIKDKTILKSISYLKNLEFDKNDVKYMHSLNIILPVLSGNEAINFVRDAHMNVKFAQLASKNTHAQYDFDNRCIKINEIYKNTQNPAEILAISEAILHEIGHAKDGDGRNSIQEEIECLALNTITHRVFEKEFPLIFTQSNSPIVKNGVCLYTSMFFDNTSSKPELVKRLKQKYGELPAGDLKHPPNTIALSVKS